jgi:hypothetical protein
MAMNVFSRTKGIMLKPKGEWVKIKDESLPFSKLFSSYVLNLAFIPAAVQFLRYSLVGFKLPYHGWYRFGIGMAFLRAVLVYALILGSVYLLGLVINALTPAFASSRNLNSAMNLAAYGLTPLWLGSALYLIPFLGRLDILVGLYGIYILYLGFATPLGDGPKAKTSVSLISLLISVVAAGLLLAILWVVLDTIFTVGRVSRLI